MNAPNPNLPPALLRSYEHAIEMELAAQRIATMIPAIRAAAAPAPVMVWCQGVPFTGYAEAARFMIDLGASTRSVSATQIAIKRAAHRGVPEFGFRWSTFPDQQPGERKANGRPGIPVMRHDTGRVYPQILDAAKEESERNGVALKTAHEHIRRAVRRKGKLAYGTTWGLAPGGRLSDLPAMRNKTKG